MEAAYPEVVFIVAWDFNKSYLSFLLPNYYQHVDYPTSRKVTLDHCYTPFQHIRPSLALLLVNLTTTPFCFSPPTNKDSRGKFR